MQAAALDPCQQTSKKPANSFLVVRRQQNSVHQHSPRLIIQMRLSEVLRCGYTHGISSLCVNRKRGRVSLEDLREVESLRAKTHPTSRPGPDLIAALYHPQQTQAPADEEPTPEGAASLDTCTLQLTPTPTTAESGAPSSEDCSTQQEEGSWGIGSRTGSRSDCLQPTSVVSSPAQTNLQLCLAHPALLQQQQLQQEQLSADHTHDHHMQWQACGQDALQQRAVLAGWAGKPHVQDLQEMCEMQQAGQLSWSEGNDESDSSIGAEDEELDSSEGTSDFEDAYSVYGTTEEEEENNSIPPADLEAILAENTRLWGQQQQQQQQQARPLQAEQQMQAESQAQEQQQ